MPKERPIQTLASFSTESNIPPDIEQGFLYFATTKLSIGDMRAFTALFAGDCDILNCVHEDIAVQIFSGLNQIVYRSSSNESAQKLDERLGTQLISKAINSLDTEVAP